MCPRWRLDGGETIFCVFIISQDLYGEEMVTAAVLGAAVGVGTALVLALTVLIYRYHAAQKKSGLNRSWSDRDSWAPSSSRPNTYKSTMQTDAGHHRPNALNRPIQFYLPLNNSTTSTKV